MNRRFAHSGQSSASRRGSLLVIVLVVIVLLSLAAYTFTDVMITESEASVMQGRAVAARSFALSGVEYAAAWLETPDELETENLYHNPTTFAGVLMQDAPTDRARGRFTIIAPVETDPEGRQIRFGLIDESGKLNLNAIPLDELDDVQARDMLLYIPNMTEEIADSILDWVDSDDERRQYGAEDDTYQSMSPPYVTKNGPLETLDELLLVNGVTPALLYGEDANRNGLLDPNEDDGDISLPSDNEDGILDLGWSAYLTIYSRESNLRSDGTEKIDVNQSLLTELYDELEAEFGEEIAQFITAYRMYGATNVDPLEGDEGSRDSTGDLETDEALRGAAQSLAQAAFGGEGESVTRGGLDLSQGGSQKIESLYELIDAEVEGQVNGTRTTLISPWTSDPGDLAENLPILFDTLSTTANPYIEGRVNINQARYEVLLGIPDMPVELADGIVSSQMIGSDGQPLEDRLAIRNTTGWLLIEGLADLTTMRTLDKYITARGGVYRAQVLGHFDAGGPVARLDAVIDVTEFPARIVSCRDISQLGPGYRLEQMFSETGL
ncbi:Putative type II secretion system protein K [Maioricimonas rarisocia]|uniref:Type II secretion system protein K n=1 Tax=Maioricimonas rarisocia TaxID=2528026 RepID=A0A517Z5H2_9PLAN|nr:type II secretion system protein GspK [Maioricimonas rarisocia]QDU37742.1 Putative type II secretion system protein K [Maioricimonas rarisocia]